MTQDSCLGRRRKGGGGQGEVIKMLFGRGAAWKGFTVLRPLLVNSPIFSLRLVYMTVGASAHFASFVLEQVLDALPFAGQLHFKVIVHFSTTVWAAKHTRSVLLLFKASAWEATKLLQRARFGNSASCLPPAWPFLSSAKLPHSTFSTQLLCTVGDAQGSGRVQGGDEPGI